MEPINLEFPCDAEAFKHLRMAAAGQGLYLPDEAHGEIEYKGIKARFTYDGRVLRITVYDKPWVYPSSVVKSRLEEAITKAMA